MRMTRAALRAQAPTEELPELVNQYQSRSETEQGAQKHASPAQIHEDPVEVEAECKPETNRDTSPDPPVRPALRDITDENYPQADSCLKIQLLSPVKLSQKAGARPDEPEPRKSTRKGGSKAKGRTTKKTGAPTVVESEAVAVELPVIGRHAAVGTDLPQDRPTSSQEPLLQSDVQPVIDVVSVQTEGYEALSDPGPAIEESHPEQQPSSAPADLTTPKFDPAIHITGEPADTAEDSFVNSIRSRSPAKLAQSQSDEQERSDSLTRSLQAHPPLRRPSSAKFEESFEAMDSLEDTIEQLTAGLPMLPAEEMHSSPDSPLNVGLQSQRSPGDAATPNSSAARTPLSASSKLQSVLRAHDKENTPPVSKSPLSTKKTASKSKTAATTKQPSPLKTTTPAAKHANPSKTRALSVQNPSTKPVAQPGTAKKTSAPRAADQTSRRPALSSNAPKTTAAPRKATVPLPHKLSQKQPGANSSSVKTEPPKSATAVAEQKKSHHASVSLSNSPAKAQPNMHKRRVTSHGTLSTSKPGFVPTKSTKPPTTSTFTLPSEAIAEKLKAQKEAREERMKQPPTQATLAEQKAAKLKADREAREERVRLNQRKAKQIEAEKQKPARPVSMSVLTVSKARAEAAERGRLASKEWAEKMLKKKQTEAVGKPQGPEGVTT